MEELEPPIETFDFRTLLRPWVRRRLEEWEQRQPDWLGPKPDSQSPTTPTPDEDHALD